MPDINAVIFDLDGTLIDSEPLYREVDRLMLAGQGITVAEHEWEDLIGVAGQEFIARMKDRFGIAGDPDELLRKNNLAYLELARGATNVFPPMRELLLQLILAGVKLGVASSSRRTVLDAMLAETGFDAVFTASVSSDDVENLKPAPDAFLTIAAAMEVEPGECCVIEDSQYGVEAAVRAGMSVVGVPAPGHEDYPSFSRAGLIFPGGAAALNPADTLSFMGIAPAPGNPVSVSVFRETVYGHYRREDRSLPWRETLDPYKVLVSEIMLQQTQSQRVIAKYKSFLNRFPTVEALAESSLKEVLSEWQGLGYNRRGKSLHDAARLIAERFHGKVPESLADLRTLPGVGAYTAGAVRAFAFSRPSVFIETNIRRVMIQVFCPDRESVSDRDLFPLIGATLDHRNPRQWYYGLMDYGAYLGRSFGNANRRSRHYTRQAPLAGSVREVRGRIVALLSETDALPLEELERRVAPGDSRFSRAIEGLLKDGMVVSANGSIDLP